MRFWTRWWGAIFYRNCDAGHDDPSEPIGSAEGVWDPVRRIDLTQAAHI